MSFLKKVQSLPEAKRKIILWAGAGIIALICLTVWLNITLRRLENMDRSLLEQIGLPDLRQEGPSPQEEIERAKEYWQALQELDELVQKGELSEEDIERFQQMFGEEFSLEDLEELRQWQEGVEQEEAIDAEQIDQ